MQTFKHHHCSHFPFHNIALYRKMSPYRLLRIVMASKTQKKKKNYTRINTVATKHHRFAQAEPFVSHTNMVIIRRHIYFKHIRFSCVFLFLPRLSSSSTTSSICGGIDGSVVIFSETGSANVVSMGIEGSRYGLLLVL